MKNIFKYISLLVVSVLLMTSCEGFLDVNEDPNNPTSVTPDLILPVAQKYSARLIQDDRRINHIGNMMMYNWSQSDGYSWYNDEFLYSVTSSFYTAIFNESYTNAMKQYHLLSSLEGETYAYYQAIGTIMKAYHFQLLVDFYGDVPYTEALQRSGEATPVYDDGATIYASLVTSLDEAIALIKGAPGDVVTLDELADNIYAGNMTSWIKLANTIKLRILVRESDVTDVTAMIASIETEGTGFITADVLVNPGYALDNDRQNPMWDDFGQDVAGTDLSTGLATCATPFVLQVLTDFGDPRINYIFEEPETGHLGVIQGLDDYDTPVLDAYIPDLVSNIGIGILKSPIMGANIFSLSEAYFLQAEAAFKGLLSGNVEDYYKAAVTASFDYLEAPGADSYLSQATTLVGWTTAVNLGREMETIITQKWLAMIGITAEQSWFDYSRTGFPAGLPVSEKAGTADRPVRLFYPATEISSNGENVPTQPDAFTEKVFWAN